MAAHQLKGTFTVDEYHRLGELGILHEDDRVELIDGEIVEMSPIGRRHADCVRRLNRLLSRALPDAAILDVQNPVVLHHRAEPQPDLAVLKPKPEGYPDLPGPGDTLLVIEVADSTVAYDRNVKGPLYARAGIPELWLVDLPAAQVEVYREPIAGKYTSIRSVSAGEILTPLHFPNIKLQASEILV